MQSVAHLSILLAFATLALASSQQAGPEQVQPSQGAPVVESASVQVHPEQVQPQPQSVVVSNAPVGHSSEHANGVVAPIEHQIHHQIHHQQQHQQQAFPAPAYYAPAGLIQVVGEQQQQQHGVVGANSKPAAVQQGALRAVEQYGQPESAALPPNYKPFGSWGLYIGGNPADGYYTNYYKQLGNSVEKAQAGGVEQVVSAGAPLKPMLKQSSTVGVSSPFAGGDYYPFAYSMNDLSSPRAAFVGPLVEGPAHSPGAAVHQAQQPSSVQAGSQFYGSPSYESGISPYAAVESYAATKRLGSGYTVQQKEVSKVAEMPAAAAKSYQVRYVYPQQQQQVQVGPLSAPVAFSAPVATAGAHQQHQQVVAYPVPVASQIVGSQAGVDGAFAPYGVHAFTRYAVKPTVVASTAENSHHYGVSSQLPVYKQHQQQQHHSHSHQHQYQTVGPSYYPLSYYGYPLSQLHYSQQAVAGSSVPAVHAGGEAYAAPASQVEASEKSESSSDSDKSQVNKSQQKRA